MSEEQKEHEAVKLANIIDRLHSLGVVKPGKLGKSIISERSFSDSIVYNCLVDSHLNEPLNISRS